MRFVVKPDSDMTAKLLEHTDTVARTKLCNIAHRSQIKDSIYRQGFVSDDGWESVVTDQLALSYHGKCAYCENTYKLDVEHYRPKKKVTGDSEHNGYYWLCYEWSNLIPACIACNRDGGKHTHFPILGERIYNPPLDSQNNVIVAHFDAKFSPLADEKPMLLHPEVDQPEPYFDCQFDSRGIRLVGKDADGRGAETINICNLNRQDLMLDRQRQVVDEFVNKIKRWYMRFNEQPDKLIELYEAELDYFVEQSKEDSPNYTFLRRYLVKSSNHFKALLAPYLRNVEAIKHLLFAIADDMLPQHS